MVNPRLIHHSAFVNDVEIAVVLLKPIPDMKVIFCKTSHRITVTFSLLCFLKGDHSPKIALG
jgi:hypothetical protein